MTSPTSGPETMAAPSARPRGRPREFDCDDVLDKATAVFWEKGFEATSVSDLVDATGLNKSSLYNAFGSKDELFSLALDRYMDLRVGMMTSVLTSGTSGLDDIEMFLDLIHQEATSDEGRLGCLAINTGSELGLRNESMADISHDFRSHARGAIRAALGRAEDLGEIETGSADRCAAILLAFMLSLPTFTRSGADLTEIETQFDAAKALLADWRIDD